MANIFNKLFKNKRSVESVPFQVVYNTSTYNTTNLDSTSIACLDLICSTVASLPLDLYDKQDKSKHVKHYLYDVFRDPNPDETRFTFFYNLVKDYFYGNAYIYKYKNTDDQVIALFRIDPKNIQISRDAYNKKVFRFNDRLLDSNQILHIPSRYGYDGLKGKSIWEFAHSTFSTLNEINEYTTNSFNNSLGKRMIIDITQAFPNATPEQVEALRNKYIANYSGIENAGKPIVKSNRVSFETLDSGTPDNRANQLMENREFQEREITKLFGTPLSFIKGENKYNSIEGLYTIFLDTAIKPITTVFEESFNKLLYLNERDRMIFEFNYNALLKTSLSDRIEAYTKQLTHGIISVNECRRKENLPPIEAGDNSIIQGGNFLILTPENIDAYMAKSKIEMEQHNALGDDK